MRDFSMSLTNSSQMYVDSCLVSVKPRLTHVKKSEARIIRTKGNGTFTPT